MIRLLDTHCHPAFLPPGRRRAFMEQARAAGVRGCIAVSARPSDWPILEALAREHDNTHIALGIHPWFCNDDSEDARITLRKRLKQAVAIGECGLDGRAGQPPMDRQRRTLAWQLDLAREAGLPVILHCVRAAEPLMEMLAARPGLAGVIHGFSGGIETAQRFLQEGFLIGLGPLLLNPRARRIRRCARALPENALLLETDTPGADSAAANPALLTRVAEEVAALRGVDARRIAAASDANAARLFALENVI